jgi:hypothetical protein
MMSVGSGVRDLGQIAQSGDEERGFLIRRARPGSFSPARTRLQQRPGGCPANWTAYACFLLRCYSTPYTGNGAAQIVVKGTMTATGDTFVTRGGGASIQVNSGGELTATNSTFGVNSLNLNPGSSGQLAADVIQTELAIESGSTFSQAGNITGNDFSSASASVLATGSSTTTIYLTHNYWGTMPIPPKIKSDGPTVVYTPTQPNVSPPGAVTRAVAVSPTPVTFSTSSQTVTLSANVTSGATKVSGGSVMFTILNGINIIGKPITATIASGTASGDYTLPGSTAAGTYTIQAIYLGTASYLGSIDAAHALTVNTAATTTTPAPAQTFYSTTA